MVKSRKITRKDGVVRRVPVEYNKVDGGATTIAVSVKKVTAGLLDQRAKQLKVSRSKLVDDILRKELK